MAHAYWLLLPPSARRSRHLRPAEAPPTSYNQGIFSHPLGTLKSPDVQSPAIPLLCNTFSFADTYCLSGRVCGGPSGTVLTTSRWLLPFLFLQSSTVFLSFSLSLTTRSQSLTAKHSLHCSWSPVHFCPCCSSAFGHSHQRHLSGPYNVVGGG